MVPRLGGGDDIHEHNGVHNCSKDLQAVNRCVNDIHQKHDHHPCLDGLATMGAGNLEALRCSFVEEAVPAVALELGIRPWICRPEGKARVLL
jgi:hypothetical protein